MSDIAPTTGDQHLEPFGDDFHSGRLVMMTTYVQDGVLEAAPSAAPLVMQDFGSLGIKEYLGPAPNQSDGSASPRVVSCFFSDLCRGQCRRPAVSGDVAGMAKYAAINQGLDGVKIESDAKVDRHRKRWVYVYCEHCRRHRRNIRLDSLRRKAKVGPDRKLRKAAMSCGCLSKKTFRRNVASMATQVPFGKKLKIWTAMKLGRDTAEVANEYHVNRWVVGFVTKQIGKLAVALRKESRIRNWAISCGGIRQNLQSEGLRSELTFFWKSAPKRKSRQGQWVCHMQSEVKRAQKIVKKWAYFKASPVREVRETMELAEWVVGAYRRGKKRLIDQIRKHGNRPTVADKKKQRIDQLCKAFENRLGSGTNSAEAIRCDVSELVKACNEVSTPPRPTSPRPGRSRSQDSV